MSFDYRLVVSRTEKNLEVVYQTINDLVLDKGFKELCQEPKEPEEVLNAFLYLEKEKVRYSRTGRLRKKRQIDPFAGPRFKLDDLIPTIKKGVEKGNNCIFYEGKDLSLEINIGEQEAIVWYNNPSDLQKLGDLVKLGRPEKRGRRRRRKGKETEDHIGGYLIGTALALVAIIGEAFLEGLSKWRNKDRESA